MTSTCSDLTISQDSDHPVVARAKEIEEAWSNEGFVHPRLIRIKALYKAAAEAIGVADTPASSAEIGSTYEKAGLTSVVALRFIMGDISTLRSASAEIANATLAAVIKCFTESRPVVSRPSQQKSQLDEALVAYEPEVAASFKRMIRRQFDEMVQDHGPALDGIQESRRWSRIYRLTIFHLLNWPLGETKTLNERELETKAKDYACKVVRRLRYKLWRKMGKVDNGQIQSVGDGRLCITGTIDSQHIRLEQNTIINTNRQGTLFNQFPSRIYVNGQFIPVRDLDKKLKELTE